MEHGVVVLLIALVSFFYGMERIERIEGETIQTRCRDEREMDSGRDEFYDERG